MTDPALLATYEQRFRRDADPWGFETSDYEIRKRRATLAACGPGEHTRTLELGAANGVLAGELCRISGQVVAVEGVPAAAALASEHLAELNAQVVVGLIPGAVPAGPYDLVVASEILYYLDAASYDATLAALPTWLAPGGRLVAVHWRPATAERPRDAAAVHADLRAVPELRHLADAHTDDYLLSVLERRP